MASNVKSNAEEYINKLYDHAHDTQKQQLVDAYKVNNSTIDAQQQNTQKQAQEYTERANLEAQKVAQTYSPANVSDSYKPQASLAVENQQKNNVASIGNQQQAANAEYERLRKLYADQYSAAIKQAQAENDMAKAQQLYEAAKAKESQLKAFASQMGTLDNEALLNQIYDSATEAQRQQIAAQQAETMSELEAKQMENQRQTDQNLTQAYVNALKGSKNYNEVQNAYGLGSGNMAQAQLARELGAAAELTELRRLQMAGDAALNAGRVEAQKSYADTLAKALQQNEQARAQAMYAEALTQQPKKKATSGGNPGGPGPQTGTTPQEGTSPENGAFGYDDVRSVVSSAQAQGTPVAEIQGIINAAYRDGEISNEQRMNLSYIYANSANKQNQNKGTSGGAGLLTVRTKDEFR